MRGYSPEPIGSTCNEHPRHDFSAFFSNDGAKALRDTGICSDGGIYPDQFGTPSFSSNVARRGVTATNGLVAAGRDETCPDETRKVVAEKNHNLW